MRRIPGLDAVRGVAALVILSFHWRFHAPALATAVDLFFVLSAYPITSILLETLGRPHAFRTDYADVPCASSPSITSARTATAEVGLV
jgi:peptidoglycan/LPS O-acetylase OafA/YrhL